MGDFGSILGHFGAILVHFGAVLGHFGVTLWPLWAYRRRMAGMMCVVAGLMVSWSDPNGSKNKISIFAKDFAFQKSHELAKEINS